MPDETTRKQRKRYFSQEDTRDGLKDAIYAVESIDVLDEDRIMQALAQRLNDYPGNDNRLEFRRWAVAWFPVTRSSRRW